MIKLSRTRELYRKIIQGKAPNESQKLQAIELGRNLTNLTKHKGWTSLQQWIETQRKGATELLYENNTKISLITVPMFFSNFLKYVFVVLELRAYKKIDVYIKTSIERGIKYAAELEKAEKQSKQP